MRLNLLFGLLILTPNLAAQDFTEATLTPFENVELSFIAFADVDGDNDNDVLITGFNGSAAISKLYINDGDGTFTEMHIPAALTPSIPIGLTPLILEV